MLALPFPISISQQKHDLHVIAPV